MFVIITVVHAKITLENQISTIKSYNLLNTPKEQLLDSDTDIYIYIIYIYIIYKYTLKLTFVLKL